MTAHIHYFLNYNTRHISGNEPRGYRFDYTTNAVSYSHNRDRATGVGRTLMSAAFGVGSNTYSSQALT